MVRRFTYPHMERDEVVAFKAFNSRAPGRVRFSAHSSVEDATTRDDAPRRQGVEIRTVSMKRDKDLILQILRWIRDTADGDRSLEAPD